MIYFLTSDKFKSALSRYKEVKYANFDFEMSKTAKDHDMEDWSFLYPRTVLKEKFLNGELTEEEFREHYLHDLEKLWPSIQFICNISCNIMVFLYSEDYIIKNVDLFSYLKPFINQNGLDAEIYNH